MVENMFRKTVPVFGIVIALCSTVPCRVMGASSAWYPFTPERQRTTVGELFSDIRKEENRVTPEQFIEQLNEHGRYSFKSLDDAQTYFEGQTTARILPCSWDEDGMPPGVGILRTNKDGTRFSVWRRTLGKRCEKGELIVYDGGDPKFSLYCGNVITTPHDASRQAKKVEPVVVASTRYSCRKSITPSFRQKYLVVAPVSGFGGMQIWTQRSGSLIETGCPQ